MNLLFHSVFLNVSLHQGRGGVAGPIGIIGPNGSTVCIIQIEMSFHISLCCCTPAN